MGIRHAGRARASQYRSQVLHPCQPFVTAGQQRFERRQHFIGRTGQFRESQHGFGLGLGGLRLFLHLQNDFFRADLGQLVECSQDGSRLAGQVKFFQQAVEDHAVIDLDGKVGEANGAQQVVDHQRRLDVGNDTGSADRVEVALHELAIASALRVLAAPDGGDVVTFERSSQLRNMLSNEAGERDGQVEPQAHSPAAMIDKLVQLSIGLLAPLAGQDLQVFQRGCIDRTEAIRTINAPGCLDQLLARHHDGREVIAESLERSGRNQ